MTTETTKDAILDHLNAVANCLSECWEERQFLAVGTVERLGKAINHIGLAMEEINHD